MSFLGRTDLPFLIERGMPRSRRVVERFGARSPPWGRVLLLELRYHGSGVWEDAGAPRDHYAKMLGAPLLGDQEVCGAGDAFLAR